MEATASVGEFIEIFTTSANRERLSLERERQNLLLQRHQRTLERCALGGELALYEEKAAQVLTSDCRAWLEQGRIALGD